MSKMINSQTSVRRGRFVFRREKPVIVNLLTPSPPHLDSNPVVPRRTEGSLDLTPLNLLEELVDEEQESWHPGMNTLPRGFRSESPEQSINLAPLYQSTPDHQSPSTSSDPVMIAMSPPAAVEQEDEEEEQETLSTPIPANPNSKETFLITYSQADVLKVPDRASFGRLLADTFNSMEKDGGIIVNRWTCGAETHSQTSGFHYHLAMEMKKPRRWIMVRRCLEERYQMHCDFQTFENYFHAFTYVTKMDAHYVLWPSWHRTDLQNPKTSKAVRAKMNQALPGPSSSKGKEKSRKRPARLDVEVLGEIIIKNNIRTEKELAILSKDQGNEGKTDLPRWLLTHTGKKQRKEFLDTVWLIEDSAKTSSREGQSCMDILKESLKWKCSKNPKTGAPCNYRWIPAALEILQLNKIEPRDFAMKVVKALTEGRSKGANLMVVGPTNCAKSFLLKPLLQIYDTFTSPSESKFNLVNAIDKEVMFWNDIRYLPNGVGDQKFMAWQHFLNFLEGLPFNVAMPKNVYGEDRVWSKLQPVFATSDQPITRIMGGKIDVGETSQMDKRWNYVHLHHQFDEESVDHSLVSCARCFAVLIWTYGR